MDVPVPPAFVAFDSRNQQSGALIEWFYGFPKDQPVRYVEGGDFMVRMIPGFDREKSAQYNFRTVMALTKALTDKGVLASDGIEYWCKVLTFDALIGNTDRHQDKWGILWKGSQLTAGCVSFSPAFDTVRQWAGRLLRRISESSMIHNILRTMSVKAHNMNWDARDSERLSHAEMLRRLIAKFSGKKEKMLNSLHFDLDAFKYAIDGLTMFRVPVPL